MAIEKFTGLNGSIRMANLGGVGWTQCDEDTNWDGNNHISMATGSQWAHERLHVRRHNGGLLIIIESWSQWQGSTESNEEVTVEDAKTWLAKNEYTGVVGYPELDIEVL